MILGWFASLHLATAIEFTPLPSKEEMELNSDDYDDWSGSIGWF